METHGRRDGDAAFATRLPADMEPLALQVEHDSDEEGRHGSRRTNDESSSFVAVPQQSRPNEGPRALAATPGSPNDRAANDEASSIKCRNWALVFGLMAGLVLGLVFVAWQHGAKSASTHGEVGERQSPGAMEEPLRGDAADLEFEKQIEKDVQRRISKNLKQRLHGVEEQILKDIDAEVRKSIEEHRKERWPAEEERSATRLRTTTLEVIATESSTTWRDALLLPSSETTTTTLPTTTTQLPTTTTMISTSTRIETTTAPSTASLFCWSVMRADGYELSLMRSQLSEGAGIFACDKWDVFSDVKTWLSPGPPVKIETSTISKTTNSAAGSETHFLNTDVFTEAWGKIKRERKYLSCAWIVKVDPDAVFLADRMRLHIRALPPVPEKGFYFLNCKYHDGKYWMFGAVEVISRQAIQTYYSGASRCMAELDRGKLGEDTWMRQCLDKLGVQSHVDLGLLADGYCDEAPSPCVSGKVAFHPFKNPTAWFTCWREANDNNAKLHG